MAAPIGLIPRVTSIAEKVAVSQEDGPAGGEVLSRYSIFLTDAFNSVKSAFGQENVDPFGVPLDDNYRVSKRLLARRQLENQILDQESSEATINNLRENSLARQIDKTEKGPATIRLIRRRTKEELSQTSSSEDRLPWINLIPANTKFFLEQVQENREEKVQVIDTFGEWIAFFFGRKPEVYSYAGTLLNTDNHDWKNEFQINYDAFLRGTQAVKSRSTVFLQYDSVLVEGYVLNASISQTGAADNSVPFTFNMLVINRSPINKRGILGLRRERLNFTAAEQALFDDLNESLDLANAGRVDELETFLLMREYFSGHYIPGSGTSSLNPSTGNIDGNTSTAPGQVGGVKNNEFPSASVSTLNTDKIIASAVISPSLASLNDELAIRQILEE